MQIDVSVLKCIENITDHLEHAGIKSELLATKCSIDELLIAQQESVENTQHILKLV